MYTYIYIYLYIYIYTDIYIHTHTHTHIGKHTKNDEVTRYQKQELGTRGSAIGRGAALTNRMVVGSISYGVTGIFH